MIYIHSEYHIGTSKIKDISDTFKSKIGVLALTTNLVVRNVREKMRDLRICFEALYFALQLQNQSDGAMKAPKLRFCWYGG